MIARALAITIITVLCGCATASPSAPRLNAVKVTRIAERKAQESVSHRLSQYNRTPIRYDRDGDAWWVSYSPKHPERDPFSHGFKIEVRDKTGEAWLVLP